MMRRNPINHAGNFLLEQLMLKLAIVFVISCNSVALAHDGHDHPHPPDMRTWRDADGLFEMEASFVSSKDGNVTLRKHNGGTVTLPISKLSAADQKWLETRTLALKLLNGDQLNNGGNQAPAKGAEANQTGIAGQELIRKQFAAFADKAKLRFDRDYFYVESHGFPDHQMMVGITAWQQQVPIRQHYFGDNAWRIPLKPRFADKPVSAKEQLFRGAIALAVNGVPIFNPIKNDGRTDTLLAGELDQFGGHCGRADDYHYHIAPVHLEKAVGKGNPIAYALDGYPIYGYTDASGKEPKDLDEFNGRMEKDGYRYYATRTYPYINGGMRGVVEVRDDQIDPQPRATPIRPSLPPLRGAKIVDFERDDEQKMYRVIYERDGKKESVRYSQKQDGSYSFVFVDGNGKARSEEYRERERGGDPENKASKKRKKETDRPAKNTKKKGQPKKDEREGEEKQDNAARLPWLAAHFDELDTNHDDSLTKAELTREIEKTFAGYDTNNDGQLSSAELDGGRGNVKSALAGFVRGHAEELKTADDKITKESMSKAILGMFERSDRAGTGKLTKEQASRTGRTRNE